MGEAQFTETKLAQSCEQSLEAMSESMVVDTLGGRVRVRWDAGASATPMGQMVFFAEFLNVAGVF